MAATSDVADVLIIGSGAAAGPFAWHLSKHRGLKIVCLEQGDWATPPPGGHATSPEAPGERQRLAAPPPKENVRQFKDGYPYDHSESYWQPILGNAVGGATVHYQGVWARLHPSDFRVRTLDAVADDWPIRYEDLAPYYDQIDNFAGIAGVPGNPAYPRKSVRLMPPHKLSPNAQVLRRGFEKLGWHWWPGEMAFITKPLGRRKPCPNGCTFCDEGCPRQAKNSADVVFWPEALRNGVVLKTRARVREITVNSRGLADGALYYDAKGTLQKASARLVVLACNGIGTPRLLLNSTSKLFPHGLANSNGVVGRYLLSHPQANVSAVFDHEVAAPRRELTAGLVSDQFYESEKTRGFARGFWWLSIGNTGPISVALGAAPVPPATVVPASLRAGNGVPIPWGASHQAAFQERFGRTVSLGVLCDQLPDEDNRLELHPTLTDESGVPAVKLFFRRTENTERILSFSLERTKELMQAAGASQIVSAQKTGAAVGHYLGTTRMGVDPRRSVVDKWGRAHDVKNLFIIDGSVFTTAGSVTPTSTIQALALRTADYIRTNSRDILGQRPPKQETR